MAPDREELLRLLDEAQDKYETMRRAIDAPGDAAERELRLIRDALKAAGIDEPNSVEDVGTTLPGRTLRWVHKALRNATGTGTAAASERLNREARAELVAALALPGWADDYSWASIASRVTTLRKSTRRAFGELVRVLELGERGGGGEWTWDDVVGYAAKAKGTIAMQANMLKRHREELAGVLGLTPDRPWSEFMRNVEALAVPQRYVTSMTPADHVLRAEEWEKVGESLARGEAHVVPDQAGAEPFPPSGLDEVLKELHRSGMPRREIGAWTRAVVSTLLAYRSAAEVRLIEDEQTWNERT